MLTKVLAKLLASKAGMCVCTAAVVGVVANTVPHVIPTPKPVEQTVARVEHNVKSHFPKLFPPKPAIASCGPDETALTPPPYDYPPTGGNGGGGGTHGVPEPGSLLLFTVGLLGVRGRS